MLCLLIASTHFERFALKPTSQREDSYLENNGSDTKNYLTLKQFPGLVTYITLLDERTLDSTIE